MTICIHTGKACRCQPQEGQLCEFGPQPRYTNGPVDLPPASELVDENGRAVKVYTEAQVHMIWSAAFEAGRWHEIDNHDLDSRY